MTLAAVALSASACSLIIDTKGLAGSADLDAGADRALPVDADAPDGGSTADGTARSAYRDGVLSDRPVAYWPFDDVAGTAGAVDIVGGNTAVGMGGKIAFGGAGVAGTSVTVDGAAALVVGNVFDFAGVAPYSLEAWIRPQVAAAEFYEVVNKRSALANGYVLYVRKGTDGSVVVQFEQNSATGSRGANRSVLLGTWQHVVVTFDPGAGTRLYVDGMFTSGYADPGAAPKASTQALVLGGGFIGALDEIAFYDHALSAARVAAHSALGHR